MKTKFIPFLSVLVLAVGTIVSCSDQQPTSSPQQTSTMPATAVVPQNPVTANQLPMVASATAKQIAITPEDMLAANWMVVLDNSGSMTTKECSGQDTRMVAGGKAVIDFSQKRPANDNFGLVLFIKSEPHAQVAVPLGRNKAAFEREVRNARPDFSTPLGPAIQVAYKEIEKQLELQGGYGSYHIVVVTDGQWNQGTDPKPIVQLIVQKSPVQIHTVGFCTGEGHGLHIPGYASYASADNIDQVNQALQVVSNAESEVFTDSQFSK